MAHPLQEASCRSLGHTGERSTIRRRTTPQPSPSRTAGRQRPNPRLLAWISLLALVGGVALGLTRLRSGPHARDVIDLSYGVQVVDPAEGHLEVLLQAKGIDTSAIYLGFSSNPVARSAPASKFRVRSAYGENGERLEIQPDQGVWKIKGAGSAVTVQYEVFLQQGRRDTTFEEEVLSRCDADGARLVGSDVFLFPVHARASSIHVDYDLPHPWDLFHPFQSGATTAVYPDIESLYYSVVAVGPYRTLTRTVNGCELVLAIQGNFSFGDADLMNMIGRIAELQLEFFGGPVRPRYLFVVNPHPHSDDAEKLRYFGLHFDASMIVLLDERTDRHRLQAEPAHICAHEFFHNWNGETIRQDDYAMNWFIEGVTTYYAYRFRIAARMLDTGGFARELQRRYEEEYLANPLRGRVSPAAAGGRVLQDQDTTRLLYASGLVIAAALNQAIDQATAHERSLDDLMRNLVDEARSDPSFVLDRKSLELELHQLTGRDFGPWLSRYVYGTEVTPLPGRTEDDPAR
jgi:predicted metalloprotease with PDZ domain